MASEPIDPTDDDAMAQLASDVWRLLMSPLEREDDVTVRAARSDVGRAIVALIRPPDSIVLPRAEVEALRAIVDAAERWFDAGADTDASYHALVDLMNAVMTRRGDSTRAVLTKRVSVDLHPLDDLPPLKLADNPLDETDVEPAQH